MSRYYVDGAADREFAEMMVVLAEACGATLTETQVRVYAQLLSDVEPSDLRRAFRAVVNEPSDRRNFLPGVPEIRKFLKATAEDAALLAWTALDHAAGAAGAWASVEVEDACAADALLSVFGSWPAFCEAEDGPQLAMKRQEFLAAYRQRRREGRTASAPVRLAGRCESSGGQALQSGRTWTALITSDARVIARRDQPRLAGAVGKGAIGGAVGPEGQDAQAGEGGARSGGTESGAGHAGESGVA